MQGAYHPRRVHGDRSKAKARRVLYRDGGQQPLGSGATAAWHCTAERQLSEALQPSDCPKDAARRQDGCRGRNDERVVLCSSRTQRLIVGLDDDGEPRQRCAASSSSSLAARLLGCLISHLEQISKLFKVSYKF